MMFRDECQKRRSSIVGVGFMLYHGSWFYRQEKCCHNHDSIEIFACPPILYYRLPSPARPWNSKGYTSTSTLVKLWGLWCQRSSTFRPWRQMHWKGNLVPPLGTTLTSGRAMRLSFYRKRALKERGGCFCWFDLGNIFLIRACCSWFKGIIDSFMCLHVWF